MQINVKLFFLCVLQPILVFGAIDTNNTQTRTWKYFGHFFSKFGNAGNAGNGIPVIAFPVLTGSPLQVQLQPQLTPSQTSQPLTGELEYVGPSIPYPPPLIPNNPNPPAVILSPETSTNPIQPIPGDLPYVGPLITYTPPISTNDPVQAELPVVAPMIPSPPTVQDPTWPTLSPDTVTFPSFEPLPAASPFPTSIPSLPSNAMFEPSATSVAFPVPTGPVKPSLTSQVSPVVVSLAQASTIVPSQCACVPQGTCTTTFTAGRAINVRIVTQNPSVNCPAGQQYCCTQGPEPLTDNCGMPNVIAGVTPSVSQANLGEYPWSGIILNSANQYIGGAALISSSHLLTAAHKVSQYGTGTGLKIRLGEWDLGGTYEPVQYVEFPVQNIVIHPSYVPVTLQNDIAIIIISGAASLLTAPTPQVNTVCLPAATDIFTGVGCFVAGWGKDNFNGNYQNIIKKVDVPVMGSVDCQTRLRQTKLGPNWALDTTSFICAGGEVSKDACEGDGGNALVCPKNGRYVVAGITAGGVECGHQGIPGLYVNVVSYLQWIAAQLTPVEPPPPGNIDPRKG